MMKRVLVCIVMLLQGICLYAQDIDRTPKASVELNMGYVPYKSWVNSHYVAFHNLSPTFSVYSGRLKFGAGFDWVNYYEYNYFGYFVSAGFRAFATESWLGYINARLTFYPWMSGEKKETVSWFNGYPHSIEPDNVYYDKRAIISFSVCRSMNDHFFLSLSPLVKLGRITMRGYHYNDEKSSPVFGCEIGLEYRF